MLMLEYSTILCERGRPHRTWTTEVLSIHHQNEMKSLGGPVVLAGITNSFSDKFSEFCGNTFTPP